MCALQPLESSRSFPASTPSDPKPLISPLDTNRSRRAVLLLVTALTAGASAVNQERAWSVAALNAWADGGDARVAVSLSGVEENDDPPAVVAVDGGWLIGGLAVDEARVVTGPSPLRRATLEPTPEGALLTLERTDGADAAPREAQWRIHDGGGILSWRLAGGERSIVNETDLRLRRIVLDPGHGGRWTGAGGVSSGVFEKELVLEIAYELAGLLESGLGVEVILTRTADYAVGLRERARTSDELAADLFISVHLNGGPPGLSGSEVYLPEYKRPESPWYPGHNAATPLDGELPWTLRHEAAALIAALHSETVTAAFEGLAESIQNAQVELLGRRDRGVKRAPFFVIVESEAPAVLTESAFLSDPDEEALLLDPAFRRRIAEALYRGIAQYVERQDAVLFP